MKTLKKSLTIVMVLSLLVSTLIISTAFNVSAATTLPADAVKWCDWTVLNDNPFNTVGINDEIPNYIIKSDGIFGDGVGEVDIISGNYFGGRDLWQLSDPKTLYDSNLLSGKTGLAMLVYIDAASTTSQMCIELGSKTGEMYKLMVATVKGSIQLVQFPLASFKKSDGTPLTNYSDLLDGN